MKRSEDISEYPWLGYGRKGRPKVLLSRSTGLDQVRHPSSSTSHSRQKAPGLSCVGANVNSIESQSALNREGKECRVFVRNYSLGSEIKAMFALKL